MAAKMDLLLPELPIATQDFPLTEDLEIKFPNEDSIRPLCTFAD